LFPFSFPLLLLYFCLSSWEHGSFFQALNIGGLRYGQITNVMFLKVAVTDILTLFSARAGEDFFFQRKPHWLLVVCCTVALCLSTTIALAWPCGTLDEVHVCGLGYVPGQWIAMWVWLYCIGVFLVQDCLKVFTWRMIIRFNLFNNNNQVASTLAGHTGASGPSADDKEKGKGKAENGQPMAELKSAH